MTKNNNIRHIQRKLRELKLYHGKIDNINATKTRAAIIAFQKLHPPLKKDGIVGKNTRKLLFVKNIKRSYKKIITSKNNSFPIYKNIADYYGKIGDETQIGKVTSAYPLKLAWNKRITIRKFTCHKKIVDVFVTLFDEILKHYDSEEIENLGLNLFGGCYNIRRMRGGNKWSTHSWGVAIDFDPERNQLLWNKKQAELAKPQYQQFWEIVNELKLVSIGKNYDYDWMHIQAVNYN